MTAAYTDPIAFYIGSIASGDAGKNEKISKRELINIDGNA